MHLRIKRENSFATKDYDTLHLSHKPAPSPHACNENVTAFFFLFTLGRANVLQLHTHVDYLHVTTMWWRLHFHGQSSKMGSVFVHTFTLEYLYLLAVKINAPQHMLTAKGAIYYMYT